MTSAPHDPDRSTSQSAREREHLNAGIVLERREIDDLVFDGVGGTGTDGQGSKQFELQAMLVPAISVDKHSQYMRTTAAKIMAHL